MEGNDQCDEGGREAQARRPPIAADMMPPTVTNRTMLPAMKSSDLQRSGVS
jgi:hypothetical protein